MNTTRVDPGDMRNADSIVYAQLAVWFTALSLPFGLPRLLVWQGRESARRTGWRRRGCADLGPRIFAVGSILRRKVQDVWVQS